MVFSKNDWIVCDLFGCWIVISLHMGIYNWQWWFLISSVLCR